MPILYTESTNTFYRTLQQVVSGVLFYHVVSSSTPKSISYIYFASGGWFDSSAVITIDKFYKLPNQAVMGK